MGLLRALFRRLAGPEPRPAPRLVDLERAIAELEDRVEWLGADFKKLRGRVTGGLKKEPSEAAQPDEDGDTLPDYLPAPPSRIRRLRPF